MVADGRQFELAEAKRHIALHSRVIFFLPIYIIVERLHLFTIVMLLDMEKGFLCLLLNGLLLDGYRRWLLCYVGVVAFCWLFVVVAIGRIDGD